MRFPLMGRQGFIKWLRSIMDRTLSYELGDGGSIPSEATTRDRE